ncbi:phage tail sheath subtilisin-like domain-containing protein [Pantoea stewartii]|uniref:Bacteriophage Mu tail sheath protein (GpL) n=1 Tax=Pantoea stewartii subsp. stewartii DC283 TaxID=660596 RepID=H3RLN0_PANSE|nr:phage tail sheath subtilisin-like domain-containing protein [Pantoea stewartii]ARF52785.1 phage tail protein [Pantoea stewartii subsp. stewartii DC283]EHT97743.1 Bacteriophage Mu tail sheath protein (GpL) [Pantoea stewartii subsp. stewartii DC283]KAB0553981.1 phage tail protein [Pantoea stewartii subsp. stewartii]
MTVSFSNVPSNLRVPLFYAEMDNSQANTATATQRTLIIGQQLDSATLSTPNIPALEASASTVGGLCGYGSILHNMMAAYLANDTAGEIYILPIADGDDLVAASGTIAITTPPTAAGTVALYIGGTRIQISVTSTDTVSVIASDLATAINAATALPLTASASAGVITLTAKNKGALGNDIDIRLNYLGSAGGEKTPSGLGVTITAMSGGTGSPSLDDALANLGDKTFDFIINPYTDTTSLNAVKSLLSDNTGRWSYSSQLYGHSLGVLFGTYGELTAAGEARNNQHESIIGVYDSPSTPWVWAAACYGAMATSLRNDPGRPVQTLTVSGVLAPPLASRFEMTERNNLLYSGISTTTVSDDGTVTLENVITTYQTNSYGDADDSYLEIETMFLLMYVTRYLRSVVTSKYARMKLAASGTKFASGAAIVTPNIIRAELIAQYSTLETNGFVQDSTGFASGLIVEQNSSNPNRVDVLWPGVLINQMRVFALLNQFRLQASS